MLIVLVLYRSFLQQIPRAIIVRYINARDLIGSVERHFAQAVRPQILVMVAFD